jgi:hypothetical protein
MSPTDTSEIPASRDSRQAVKLARKRARDRRAQQAMRNRAKAEIDTLQQQLLHLQERLNEQESTSAQNISRLVHKNDQLRNEIKELQGLLQSHLPTSLYDAGWLSPTTQSFLVDPAVLAAWSSPNTKPLRSPVGSRSSHDSPDVYMYLDPATHADHLRVPSHTPPSCPADSIVQPLIQKMRALACGSGTSVDPIGMASQDSQPRPVPLSSSAVQLTVSKVVADILSTYTEFNTTSKKMACLITTGSVINV